MAKEDIVKYQFTSDQSRTKAAENGRKGGIRSGEVKRENKLIKDRILERMGAADWDEYIDGIIARAKESTQGAEFFRDTIGEKPKDSLKVQGDNIEIRVHNAG